MGNKISNSDDSFIIGIGTSTQKIDEKLNIEKDDAFKKRKKINQKRKKKILINLNQKWFR